MSLFRTWTGHSQRSHHSQQSKHTQQETQLQPQSPSQPQRPPSRSELHQITSNGSNADPFAGHLNHLTERQENQLAKFRSALHDHGLYRPGGQGQAASHDDQTLLRYLRARKFDIGGALAQFADTAKWSKENKIAELYDEIDVEFYEEARTMYPQWTGRRDKRGIPVYVYVVKHLDSKNVNKYTKGAAAYKAKLPFHSSLGTPAKMLPLFALYENLLRFVIPLCTSLEGRPSPEVPVTNSNNVVDISGVGLKQFWNLKNHMQEASVLATAHYPETLDRIFIIGAPAFFPTVWGWIKRWFDPVTVNKIFIIPQHEVKSRLSEFIHPDDFPKKYGGNLDWEFGMTPHLDQAALAAVEKNGSRGWIEGPCLWEQNQRVAVGTIDGKPRRPSKAEPIPVPAQAENKVEQAPPATTEPTEPMQTPAEAPAPALTPAEPEATESSNPPSMAHSGSTASTFAGIQPDALAATPTDGTAKVTENGAPVVANGAVLNASDAKPSLERFVTAFEDLHTARPQVNGVA